MKRLFALSACMLAIAAANATCHNGATNFPACDNNKPPVVTPPTTPGSTSSSTSNAAATAAAQAAALGVGVGIGVGGAGGTAAANSRNQVTANGNGAGAGAEAGAGAGSNAGQGAGSNNSNGQQVVVQGAQTGSGDNSRYLSVALPSPAPAIAPSMVGGPVAMVSMGCGPMVREVAANVTTYETGMFGGTTERTVPGVAYRPYLNEIGEEQPYKLINGRWYGHEVLREAAVISNSSGVSLSAAAFGSRGGGSGGVGTSGGTTAMAGQVMYRLCALPVEKTVAVLQAPVAVAPQPFVRKPARAVRKVAASAPSADPACMASAAQSCQIKPSSTLALAKP